MAFRKSYSNLSSTEIDKYFAEISDVSYGLMPDEQFSINHLHAVHEKLGLTLEAMGNVEGVRYQAISHRFSSGKRMPQLVGFFWAFFVRSLNGSFGVEAQAVAEGILSRAKAGYSICHIYNESAVKNSV